jgi:hypothetical protein
VFNIPSGVHYSETIVVALKDVTNESLPVSIVQAGGEATERYSPAYV